MNILRRQFLCTLWITGVIALPLQASTNVTIFNFEMKSDTPEWSWMAKGLADRITTDLFHDKTLTMMQRDQMQRIAENMRWAPEMMKNQRTLTAMKKALRMDYLISGVYTVKDGTLTITATVIDFSTNEEVARRSVSGKTSEVLSLMRRISAELMSWLTFRPVEKILKTLPVWTRSIPATRALYEGIDLYDQGRYGEAWLKFRQAFRVDPTYIEAQYWVGKMYYFMDRYRHARRAFERFVYLDSTHPRTGDAIKEYLHTYEKLNTPPEELIWIYEKLIEKYPKVLIHDDVSAVDLIRNKQWLQYKTAKLLSRLKRHKESIDLIDTHEWGTIACRIAHQNLRVHNCLTGEMWTSKWLLDWDFWGDSLLVFGEGDTELTVETVKKTDKKKGWHRNAHTKQRAAYTPVVFGAMKEYFLLAPNGRFFKSLRVYPITNDASGTLKILISKDDMGDVANVTVPLAQAIKDGVPFRNVPCTGMLQMQITLSDKRLLGKVRVVATFEQVKDGGTIDVSCSNASIFCVDVDGRFDRMYAGLIGPISPGKHTLVFRPARKTSPYERWTTQVTVKKGETVKVGGHLPWKKTGLWASWTSGTLIGCNYPSRHVSLTDPMEEPGIQADDKTIRVVWAHGGDIWSSFSEDGKVFSAPRKLPMPVSSGWRESNPQLLTTESGKFLLTFLSDRNCFYKILPYVSWSRDFVHWSAPVLVSDVHIMRDVHIIQGSNGMFFMASKAQGGGTVIRVSRDAYNWKIRGTIVGADVRGMSEFVQIHEPEPGKYEVITGMSRSRYGDKEIHRIYPRDIWRYPLAADGTPGKGEKIGTITWGGSMRASVFRKDGKTYLMCFGIKEWEHKYGKAYYWWDNQRVIAVRNDGNYLYLPKDQALASVRSTHAPREWSGEYKIWLFREEPDGTWRELSLADNVAQGIGAMSYHKRWGFMLAWMAPEASWAFPRPAYGPLLIRGPQLKTEKQDNTD